jgi:dihydroorotate dehydrogenase
MRIAEFEFIQRRMDAINKAEAEEIAQRETVDLVCDNCGEKVTRPVFIKLTGHLHDQKCTYVCTVCRGNMREVNLNQDEEK